MAQSSLKQVPTVPIRNRFGLLDKVTSNEDQPGAAPTTKTTTGDAEDSFESISLPQPLLWHQTQTKFPQEWQRNSERWRRLLVTAGNRSSQCIILLSTFFFTILPSSPTFCQSTENSQLPITCQPHRAIPRSLTNQKQIITFNLVEPLIFNKRTIKHFLEKYYQEELYE